ncbi:aminoglycoside 6'-N-acetyltransferase I [Ciceribacter lividus]|uniref:Aminoglycoside N(6')-acetyltransferase type 1 n=2 Tax=Ciceribacter lividus TaxID=1197950 RepID=A0A6I7HQM7_9HYPH|nr:aminoglycoside 6'-N-acetyltransferase [Ciceribacter lividus]RCW28141.1 aminoglycoside 6'-N-acetyltransferase I [Ciceribacter lividus]
MKVRRATVDDSAAWGRLRLQLWPDTPVDAHSGEQAAMLEAPDRFAAFLYEEGGSVCGFAEASLRRDSVNGCETSPVGFLEGIFVVPEHRRRGVAGQLVAAVEQWAREIGVRELASDADLANTVSHAMHRHLGFEETQRVVYFRKEL